MIFVTVGTQLCFDRMIRVIDQWAASHQEIEIFAQIGPSHFRPAHIRYESFLSAEAFVEKVRTATTIIAHAGMGSIITALELGKPIVVMPRRAELGEHRNNHQIATARSLLSQGKVIVAFDETHLVEKLNNLEALRPACRVVSDQASPRLIRTLREFINAGEFQAHRETVVSPPMIAAEHVSYREVPQPQ